MYSTRLFSFNHDQATASDTWTLVHGLGYAPAVSVQIYINAVLHTVLPKDIAHSSDLKTTTITFTSPQTGKAHLT